MSRKTFSLFFVVTTAFTAGAGFYIVSPAPVYAQSAVSPSSDTSSVHLIPCGRRDGQGEESQPCTACHAVVAGKRVIDYMTRVMVVVAIAVIVAMGVLYILSGANPDLNKKAKSGLTAVLWGLVFMLSAWLIVSTILRFLANDNVVNGGDGFLGIVSGEGAYGLTCSTKSDAGTASLQKGSITAGTGGYAGSSVGSGSCAPITNDGNPCSIENIKKNSCWAALGDTIVQQASGICNAESQGISRIRSGSGATDHCGSATAPVVSQGLFQVNMTAHYSAIGCPKLADPGLTNVQQHSDGWYDASCKLIVSADEVQACAQKTIDPAWNINYACQLYKDRGWAPWNYSFTNKCNSFK